MRVMTRGTRKHVKMYERNERRNINASDKQHPLQQYHMAATRLYVVIKSVFDYLLVDSYHD